MLAISPVSVYRNDAAFDRREFSAALRAALESLAKRLRRVVGGPSLVEHPVCGRRNRRYVSVVRRSLRPAICKEQAAGDHKGTCQVDRTRRSLVIRCQRSPNPLRLGNADVLPRGGPCALIELALVASDSLGNAVLEAMDSLRPGDASLRLHTLLRTVLDRRAGGVRVLLAAIPRAGASGRCS